MKPKQPPRIATWLLKHFGCGDDLDIVLGDLAERYAEKPSPLWYWRQAIRAIPVTLFREVRAHKQLAARAVLTGWVVWFASLLWLFPFVSPYFFAPHQVPKPPREFSRFESRSFSVRGVGVASFSPSDPIGSTASILWEPVGGPMSINEGGLRNASTLGFGVALPLVVAAICGWLVAYFHGRQKRAAVLLFAGSMLLMYVFLFGRFALLVGAGAAQVLGGPLAVFVAASVAGVALGGGLLSSNSKTT